MFIYVKPTEECLFLFLGLSLGNFLSGCAEVEKGLYMCAAKLAYERPWNAVTSLVPDCAGGGVKFLSVPSCLDHGLLTLSGLRQVGDSRSSSHVLTLNKVTARQPHADGTILFN